MFPDIDGDSFVAFFGAQRCPVYPPEQMFRWSGGTRKEKDKNGTIRRKILDAFCSRSFLEEYPPVSPQPKTRRNSYFSIWRFSFVWHIQPSPNLSAWLGLLGTFSVHASGLNFPLPSSSANLKCSHHIIFPKSDQKGKFLRSKFVKCSSFYISVV